MTDIAVTSTRPSLLTALASTAGVLTGLILVQAALAGQFLFKAGDIDLHGYLGNASFALGVVGVGLAVAARGPRPVLVAAVLLLAALFGQIGLGYSGRESATAASWHIPLGVTCLGLAVWLLNASLTARRMTA